MGRRAVTENQRVQLIAAFRKRPGGDRRAYTTAAQLVGVDWRTAKRAWEVGWLGFKAIRDQLAEEQVLARAELSKAALAAKASAAPSLAQEDAVVSAAREALLARAVRESAIGLVSELQSLRGYVKALAERINKPEEIAKLDPPGALDAMRAAAGTMRQLVEVAAKAQAMEHLRLGDPTSIVGVKPLAASTVTLEEAEAEVAAARRALERMKSHGRVEVVDVQ